MRVRNQPVAFANGPPQVPNPGCKDAPGIGASFFSVVHLSLPARRSYDKNHGRCEFHSCARNARGSARWAFPPARRRFC